MLVFAALARERGRLFGFLLLPFLFCFATAHGSTASAASLKVKIRQLNPDSGIQQVTCIDNTKCVLPIDIQTGPEKETLTVGISFVPGNVLFTFGTTKGFFYGGDKTQADPQHGTYETIVHRAVVAGTPLTINVTLFRPLVPNAFTALILSAAQQPVADLEITLEEAP